MTREDPAPPQHLPGGSGGVWKVGRTVRRRTGPWTPAVHALLQWLDDQGLGGIPHVGGLDAEGREVLSYVEGRGVPVDDEVVLDAVLVEAAAWLRTFHDVVESYEPPDLPWRDGQVGRGGGEIICHQDPGAYNWIIQSGHFVAMIDWDLAGPGRRIDDLAFLCWTGVPFYRDIGAAETARRLDLVVDAYGEWGPRSLLAAVVPRMTTAADRIAAGIERGDPGMIALAGRGEPQRTRERVTDFTRRLPAIEDALG